MEPHRNVPAFKQMKLDLVAFHKSFDKAMPHIKLAALKRMQENVYEFKTRQPIWIRRQNFGRAVYARYFKRPCYVCGRKTQVRHHIISLKQGGQNSKKNIVALCKNDHNEIHPWLKVGVLEKMMDEEYRRVVSN